MVSKPICWDCVAGKQLFKRCRNLSAGTVLQGCSCFKWCLNLSVDTVLQGCSCLSGVETYLPALCVRGTAVEVLWKPICQQCATGVQLFKWCRNLSAGTVLQGCSCLKGVETYLLALCCRGAAVKAVSKPICWHCVAEVQLFKVVLQPICWHCLAGVQLFKGCRNLSACTVLQRCSCLSGVETYLPALCCRGAAV